MLKFKQIVTSVVQALRPHPWSHDDHEGTRTCTVCGRHEQYMLDDPASYWDVIRSGDPRKHA